MKHLFLAVVGQSMCQSLTALTPEEIDETYQKRAVAACEKTDAVLAGESTAIAAQRVGQGEFPLLIPPSPASSSCATLQN